MITVNDIKTQITQTFVGTGFYAPTQFQDTFNKVTTVAGIDLQLTNAVNVDAMTKYPISYLDYNNLENILKLNVIRFSYINGEWQYHSTQTSASGVKWIANVSGEYSITYPPTLRQGQSFSKLLPIIYKNI